MACILVLVEGLNDVKSVKKALSKLKKDRPDLQFNIHVKFRGRGIRMVSQAQEFIRGKCGPHSNQLYLAPLGDKHRLDSALPILVRFSFQPEVINNVGRLVFVVVRDSDRKAPEEIF